MTETLVAHGAPGQVADADAEAGGAGRIGRAGAASLGAEAPASLGAEAPASLGAEAPLSTGPGAAINVGVPAIVSLDGAGTHGAAGDGARPASADSAITSLYDANYRSLVRLATLLVHDIATAEEVVQDSFVALHANLHRLRDGEKMLSYLRAVVVNRSRSVLRHRVVVDRNAPKPGPDMPSAEQGAMALIERSSVVAALRALPERQREAVVLRFYADMSEAQIAAVMGITRGAVKSHTSRAMAGLRSVLEQET